MQQLKPEMPHPKDLSVHAYFRRKLRGPRDTEYFWHDTRNVSEAEDQPGPSMAP